MKQKTLLACICLLFITKAFSQSYIPFVQEGKMWTEKWESAANPSFFGVNTYTLQADTFFNAKNYKRIVNTFNQTYFVYDDTLNKKVYVYDAFYLKDTIWYDFSLQIGDSLKIDCLTLFLINKEVVFFAGKNRTKFEFSWDIGYPIALTWYEGIGSNTGVFWPICFVGSIHKLLCYYENNALLYHDSTLSDDCFLITETPKLQPDHTFDTYFTENRLHVTLSKPVPYTLFVYDFFGRKLCQISASGDMEKDFSNLPAGMYLWRVESMGESGVFSGKFLKD